MDQRIYSAVYDKVLKWTMEEGGGGGIVPMGSHTLKINAFIDQAPHVNALRRLGLSRVGWGK